MAVIRILEMDDIGKRGTVRRAPFTTAQTPVTIAGASAQSAAFGASTTHVTVQADADCHIAFGKNPTATTSHFKVVSGHTEDFEVQGGDKVAVIQA